MPGKLLAHLDARPRLHHAGNVRVAQGVEVELPPFPVRRRQIIALPPLPALLPPRRLFDPRRPRPPHIAAEHFRRLAWGMANTRTPSALPASQPARAAGKGRVDRLLIRPPAFAVARRNANRGGVALEREGCPRHAGQFIPPKARPRRQPVRDRPIRAAHPERHGAALAPPQ